MKKIRKIRILDLCTYGVHTTAIKLQ